MTIVRSTFDQVGFHNPNMVFKAKVDTRKNEIVNRLDKTKKWVESDLEVASRSPVGKGPLGALNVSCRNGLSPTLRCF